MNSGAPPDPTALHQLQASLAEGLAADAANTSSRRDSISVAPIEGLSPSSGSELGAEGRNGGGQNKRARVDSRIDPSLNFHHHPASSADSPLSGSSHLSPLNPSSGNRRLPSISMTPKSVDSASLGSVNGGGNSLSLLADASLAAEIDGRQRISGLDPSFNLSSVTQAFTLSSVTRTNLDGRDEGELERTPGLLSKGIIDPETAVELFRMYVRPSSI